MPWGVPFPRIPADITQPAIGSPAYLDTYGMTPKDLYGKHVREVLGEAGYRQLRPHLEQVGGSNVQRDLFHRVFADSVRRMRVDRPLLRQAA